MRKTPSSKNGRPYTDLQEMVKACVDQAHAPLIAHVTEENEKTRKAVREVVTLMRKFKDNRAHTIIQYVLIVILGLSMLLLHG